VFPGKKALHCTLLIERVWLKIPIWLTTSQELELHLWSELYFHIVLDVSVRTEHLRWFFSTGICCCIQYKKSETSKPAGAKLKTKKGGGSLGSTELSSETSSPQDSVDARSLHGSEAAEEVHRR